MKKPITTKYFAMASNTEEVIVDLPPFLRVYGNGKVERIFPTEQVPPCPEDPKTGVSSKDITISPEISARVYLPKLKTPNQKLPIMVYIHGGGFCVLSAFSKLDYDYLNILASEANALVISVEYRLAPEHPLPAAYEDSWNALQWVASHLDPEKEDTEKEPWLINHGDFGKLFINGDSAGGNIVHDMLLRAGKEGLNFEVKILGAILAHPYFWGSKPAGSMSIEKNLGGLHFNVWKLVYPSAPDGIDNPMINPLAENAPSLALLGCSKLFVCTAELDDLRDRILDYVEAVKRSGWKGEIELVDVKGEAHCFQLEKVDYEKTTDLIKRMASFILQ